jgi:hypothetical protein
VFISLSKLRHTYIKHSATGGHARCKSSPSAGEV